MSTAMKARVQECPDWEREFEQETLARYRERMGRNLPRPERIARLHELAKKAPRITQA